MAARRAADHDARACQDHRRHGAARPELPTEAEFEPASAAGRRASSASPGSPCAPPGRCRRSPPKLPPQRERSLAARRDAGGRARPARADARPGRRTPPAWHRAARRAPAARLAATADSTQPAARARRRRAAQGERDLPRAPDGSAELADRRCCAIEVAGARRARGPADSGDGPAEAAARSSTSCGRRLGATSTRSRSRDRCASAGRGRAST